MIRKVKTHVDAANKLTDEVAAAALDSETGPFSLLKALTVGEALRSVEVVRCGANCRSTSTNHRSPCLLIADPSLTLYHGIRR